MELKQQYICASARKQQRRHKSPHIRKSPRTPTFAPLGRIRASTLQRLAQEAQNNKEICARMGMSGWDTPPPITSCPRIRAKNTHSIHRPRRASPGLPWTPGPPLAQSNRSDVVLRARRGGPGVQGSPGEPTGGLWMECVFLARIRG